ncbi:hypothetical protein CBW46_004640 [Paenibacillus xerothermodurans]|uniref:Uncharacterized protein n=1 Tax=Paenibacillus xerothermodurans TaxID=1977292 RepID=A0A2W1NDM4_PAEXE|nr:hypothetical protein CBW46_004640 [Paenibacillus xerothermodurans]
MLNVLKEPRNKKHLRCADTGDKGSELHTAMYMYKGEGMIGANANLMFQGGQFESKAQMGLL